MTAYDRYYDRFKRRKVGDYVQSKYRSPFYGVITKITEHDDGNQICEVRVLLTGSASPAKGIRPQTLSMAYLKDWPENVRKPDLDNI